MTDSHTYKFILIIIYLISTLSYTSHLFQSSVLHKKNSLPKVNVCKFGETWFLIEPGVHWFHEGSYQWVPRILVSPLDISSQMLTDMPKFHMTSGDRNPGSHNCMTRNLLKDAVPTPIFWKFSLIPEISQLYLSLMIGMFFYNLKIISSCTFSTLVLPLEF